MLATTALPDRYIQWNERWGAPEGRIRPVERLLPHSMLTRMGRRVPQLRGPFGFQVNNETRRFEFPWAYYEIAPRRGLHALEIGGSNSGLQFVLASEGVDVTNVDPGEDASGLGWPVDAGSIATLNRAFKTNVTFIGSTLQQAKLRAESYDVAYSISTIEHIPPEEYESLMAELRRVLRPGGRLVMTVDLFFNVSPFTSRTSNEWGVNADVAALVSLSGMTLEQGDTRQLYGFPEFSTDEILSHLERYSFGGYPAGAQCLVLKKD